MTRRFKSSLVMLLVMLGFGMASAQSMMTFYNTGGAASEQWRLLDVGKVTFDAGNIVVKHSTGSYSVAIGDVLSIKFNDEVLPDPTSVKRIDDDASRVRIASDDNTIRVIGASQGNVAIWSASGQQLYNNRNWHGETINIASLERGIYIITINQSTFKFKK